ncbi:MAG: hypothetical protein ABIF71_10965 [Planctomycetota bacterium]
MENVASVVMEGKFGRHEQFLQPGHADGFPLYGCIGHFRGGGVPALTAGVNEFYPAPDVIRRHRDLEESAVGLEFLGWNSHDALILGFFDRIFHIRALVIFGDDIMRSGHAIGDKYPVGIRGFRKQALPFFGLVAYPHGHKPAGPFPARGLIPARIVSMVAVPIPSIRGERRRTVKRQLELRFPRRLELRSPG